MWHETYCRGQSAWGLGIIKTEAQGLETEKLRRLEGERVRKIKVGASRFGVGGLRQRAGRMGQREAEVGKRGSWEGGAWKSSKLKAQR